MIYSPSVIISVTANLSKILLQCFFIVLQNGLSPEILVFALKKLSFDPVREFWYFKSELVG